MHFLLTKLILASAAVRVYCEAVADLAIIPRRQACAIPGAACASCGYGFVSCGSDCYNPSEGQTCCQDFYMCPSGYQCSSVQDYCCPSSIPLDQCVPPNGYSGSGSSVSSCINGPTQSMTITTTSTSTFVVSNTNSSSVVSSETSALPTSQNTSALAWTYSPGMSYSSAAIPLTTIIPVTSMSSTTVSQDASTSFVSPTSTTSTATGSSISPTITSDGGSSTAIFALHPVLAVVSLGLILLVIAF